MKSRRFISILSIFILLTGLPVKAVFAANDVTAPVTVTAGNHAEVGNVTVKNSLNAVTAHGSDSQTASAKVDGDVGLKNEDEAPSAIAVTAHAAATSRASIDVAGDVSAEAPEYAVGLSSVADKKTGYAEVKVGGNVTASSPQGVAQGIDTNDGNATVDGDVTANAKTYAMGVTATSRNQLSNIMIKGGLSAEGFGVQAATISAEDESGELTFSVGEGGITAVSKGGIDDVGIPSIMPISTGLLVSDGSGKLTADVQADIKAYSEIKQSAALWLGGWHSENHGDELAGKQVVNVHGNLISDDRGIFFIESDYAYPSVTDILVENEIQADNVGIMVYKHHAKLLLPKDNEHHVDPKNKLNLSVWKIKVNENGNVAEYSTNTEDIVLPEGVSPAGVDSDFEKSIMYIIKTEESEIAELMVVDADGNALEKSFNYDVAREGDKIIVKTDESSEYIVKAAYNGVEDKTPLPKDENGNFYLEVPKGGGVYLSAEYEKKQTPAYDAKDDNGNTIQLLTWQKGSNKSLDFSVERSEDDEQTYERFESMDVDGNQVSDELYEKSPGSINLSIKPEYLETLALGDHDIKVNFNDGSSTLKLRVLAAVAPEDENNPEPEPEIKPEPESKPEPEPEAAPAAAPTESIGVKTADENNMIHWLMLMGTSIIALAGGLILCRRSLR